MYLSVDSISFTDIDFLRSWGLKDKMIQIVSLLVQLNSGI